jgi:uncharacterized protein HemY
MVIIGLLLIALAVVFAASVLTGSNPSLRLDLHAFKVDTSLTGVYLSGIATLVVAAIGLWLLRSGLRKSRKRRSEVKQLRRTARASERTSPDATGQRTTVLPPDDTNDHFDPAPRDGG